VSTSASTSTVVRRRDAALLARQYARAQCAGHAPPTLVEDVELVAILATEWGVRPAPAGGKVVWCVLTPAVSG
jgi:hypothetical protein